MSGRVPRAASTLGGVLCAPRRHAILDVPVRGPVLICENYDKQIVYCFRRASSAPPRAVLIRHILELT